MALAKSKGNRFVIAYKGEKERQIWKSNNLRESNQEKKKRTNTINEGKKIKSDNLTRWLHNHFVFWW